MCLARSQLAILYCGYGACHACSLFSVVMIGLPTYQQYSLAVAWSWMDCLIRSLPSYCSYIPILSVDLISTNNSLETSY